MVPGPQDKLYCFTYCYNLPNFTQQMTKAFLPRMKEQNHGHIVTVASALGLFSTACVEVPCKGLFSRNIISKAYVN